MALKCYDLLMDTNYTIKDVSKITGLSASNIRYYEKEGLIDGVKRNDANVRIFTQNDVNWIDFLAKLKNMEMPINMMKQYAYLRAKGDSTIGQRMALLSKHKESMFVKIVGIQENIALLDRKIKIYQEMGKNLNDK